MLDAHSNAGFVVGTPFSNTGLYDFATHSSLTKQVSSLSSMRIVGQVQGTCNSGLAFCGIHCVTSGCFQ